MKAWGLKNKETGEVLNMAFETRERARWCRDVDEKVIRVEIKEVKEK